MMVVRIDNTATTKKYTMTVSLTRPHIKKHEQYNTKQYHHSFYSYPLINDNIKHLYIDINEKQNKMSNVSRNSTIVAGNIANYSPSISTNKILLVDDEPDIARLFKLVLELNGIIVDVFTDPIVALSNYKTGFYSLLLLDLKMSKMNGFKLYQKIKDKEDPKNRDVKVIFITAYEEYFREFQESFSNLDIDCFVRKPISIDKLVKTVKTKLNS